MVVGVVDVVGVDVVVDADIAERRNRENSERESYKSGPIGIVGFDPLRKLFQDFELMSSSATFSLYNHLSTPSPSFNSLPFWVKDGAIVILFLG